MTNLLVLLVDDNDALNFLHTKLCELNLPQAEVKSLSNGQVALDYLEENAAALESKEVLILLDIRMPVMDGWTFLEEVKQRSVAGKYNIVMLTSSTSASDRSKAMSYPFVMGYLEKPLRGFQLKELADELSEIPENL